MAIQKVTLVIFFIILNALTETWQEKYERLKKTPNHVFSLYHDFDLAEGESPKSELSKLINSLLGVQSSQSADAWFEFQLGDSSVFGAETQQFLGKTEEDVLSDFGNSITELFNSKMNQIENAKEIETDNQLKKELFTSFVNDAVEVSKQQNVKFLFHQLHRFNQGLLKGFDSSHLYTAFSAAISKSLDEFDAKFNQRSGQIHVYTEVNGQKVMNDQKGYDLDVLKIESHNELSTLSAELINQAFVIIQNSDGKYILEYLNVAINFANNLRKESESLLNVIKSITDEAKLQELNNRFSDLTTKQMRYFKIKKGFNTFDNQFASIGQFYIECVKQESQNSDFFNRRSLPTLVSTFVQIFESEYEPSSQAKIEILTKIRKLIAQRGLPSITNTAFMNKLNLLDRKSTDAHDNQLKTSIDHLNLIWEFGANQVYDEKLQSEIINSCFGLFSLDTPTLKTISKLNKLFYSYIVQISESSTEYYQSLYEIVLEFVSSRESSHSLDKLKSDFFTYLQNYVSVHENTHQYYISLLFNAASLIDGEDFDLKILRLSESDVQSIANFIKTNSKDIEQNLQHIYLSLSNPRKQSEDLNEILEFLSEKEINTSSLSIFGRRILL